MTEHNSLVLEVFKQDNQLSEALFEQHLHAPTVRHYTQCSVSFNQIEKLCQEVSVVLHKVRKQEGEEAGLLLNLKKSGQMLWDNLLTRQAKDKLKSTTIRHLILSLDEELIRLPWELLFDGENFLCLKFSLGRLLRTKSQIPAPQYRSISSHPHMLILANPTDDLNAAYLEGRYIKNQFDRFRDQVHIDFKSTEISMLYVKKNLRDYDIVHFAGHCEYKEEDPQESGWVLSDGKFSANDILTLGESLNLPSLVFSNACYSAADNLAALASAFLFSGVRHYIGAVWKIEDPVSLAFAKEFYHRLIGGASVGECVREARLALVKKYGLASISWATYLLYGDPNFVLFRNKAKKQKVSFLRRIFAEHKLLVRLCAIFIGLAVGAYLFLRLPTLNPNTYFTFRQAQRLFEAGKNSAVIGLSSRIIKQEPQFLAVYPLLADTYHRLGRTPEAIKAYFDYALAAERKKDFKALASAYNGIGWLNHLSGDYPKAFEFYGKAINLSRQHRDKLNEAAALEHLAVWYIDKEDNDKALELLTRSSEINREGQRRDSVHRYWLACDYFDLGLVFTNKEDLTTAKEFYRKSQQLFESMKLKHELSDCYFNLGEISLFEKQYQKALNYYFKGLKIDQLQGNLFNLASDYEMIGTLYLELGNFAEAERFFQEALKTSRQINAQPELAAAYRGLGNLYQKKKEPRRAEEFFRSSEEIYRDLGIALAK